MFTKLAHNHLLVITYIVLGSVESQTETGLSYLALITRKQFIKIFVVSVTLSYLLQSLIFEFFKMSQLDCITKIPYNFQAKCLVHFKKKQTIIWHI